MAGYVNVEDGAVGGDAVLFTGFSQDCTSLAVGGNSGLILLDVESFGKGTLDTIHDNEGEMKDVHIVNRLKSTSLLVAVSKTIPTFLKICNFKLQKVIAVQTYKSQILAVRMVSRLLVVVLEEEVVIHRLKDARILHVIRNTPRNPKGICALCSSGYASYMAYPGSLLTGEVQLFDLINMRSAQSITAHNGPLACIAFDEMGTKLATASDKGTVIRVFSVPDGEPLFEFRRGLKRYAEISCLSFSINSRYLCVSSNTETVHIFKLAGQIDDSSWMGYFSSTLSVVSAEYLPSVSAALNPERAFAIATLPESGTKSSCAMVTIQSTPYIVVACNNGYVYYYSIDCKNGGVCDLRYQQCIIPSMLRTRHLSGSASSLKDLKPERSHGQDFGLSRANSAPEFEKFRSSTPIPSYENPEVINFDLSNVQIQIPTLMPYSSRLDNATPNLTSDFGNLKIDGQSLDSPCSRSKTAKSDLTSNFEGPRSPKSKTSISNLKSDFENRKVSTPNLAPRYANSQRADPTSGLKKVETACRSKITYPTTKVCDLSTFRLQRCENRDKSTNFKQSTLYPTPKSRKAINIGQNIRPVTSAAHQQSRLQSRRLRPGNASRDDSDSDTEVYFDADSWRL